MARNPEGPIEPPPPSAPQPDRWGGDAEPPLRPARPDRVDRRRRALVVGGVSALGVGAVGGQLVRDLLWPRRDTEVTVPGPTVEVPAPPEFGVRFTAPYEGPNANRAAQELGITAGTFFNPTTETAELDGIRDKIATTPDNFFTKGGLLPIFAPTVHENGALIERLVHEVPETKIEVAGRPPIDMSPNMVAIVASIESSGIAASASGADAFGPMQVVAKDHIDEIALVTGLVGRDVGLVPEAVDQWNGLIGEGRREEADQLIDGLGIKPQVDEALQDPFIGYMVGIRVLKKYHEQAYNHMKDERPDIDPNHPKVWEHTLAAYNAGPAAIGSRFDELPVETQRYVIMADRFMMDAEVASQVRNDGIGHAATANQMISPEVNARAYALNAAKTELTGEPTRTELEAALTVKEVTAAPVLVPEPILAKEREAYLEYTKAWGAGTDLYPKGLPLTPGLRMMLGELGEAQLFKDPRNVTPAQYEAYK